MPDIYGATGLTYVPVAGDVGKAIRARVIAVNAAGQSDPVYTAYTSVITSSVTAPTGAPSLSLGTPTTTGVAVSWGAVSGATSYKGRVYPQGSPAGSYATVTSPWTTTGGAAGTAYTVDVKGSNSGGDGPSATANFTTSGAVVAPTAAPTVTPGTPTSAGCNVTFTSVSGATAHEYHVWPTSGTEPTTWTTATSPLALNSLTASTGYSIKVRGYNSAGAGPAGSATFTTAASATPVTLAAFTVAGTGGATAETISLTSGTWHKQSSSTADALISAASTDRLRGPTASNTFAGYTLANGGGVGQWAQCTFRVVANSSGTLQSGIGVFMDVDARSGYYLRFGADASTALRLMKFTTGTSAALGTSIRSTVFSTSEEHTIRIEVTPVSSSQSTIKCYLDGVLSQTYDDTASPYISGYLGFDMSAGSAGWTDAKGLQIKSFSAGTL